MEKNKEKQKRRKYAERGSRSGRVMSFRADYEVCSVLSSVNNKGRLINDLVMAWARGEPYRGKERPDLTDPLADYF